MIQEISKWILSIVGIIFVIILAEIISPNGRMKNYIKGIFSFFIVFVIVSPIPKLLNIEFDFSKLFYSSNIEINKDYIENINLEKINVIEKKIKNEMENHGYKNIELKFKCSNNSAFKIEHINVDLSSIVITQNPEHKDISKIKIDITNIIKKHVNILEENISYEQ